MSNRSPLRTGSARSSVVVLTAAIGAALALASPTGAEDQDYRIYVDECPSFAGYDVSAARPLMAELTDEVRKIVLAGKHLAPVTMHRGMGGRAVLWGNPADTVNTLCDVADMLPADLKQQAIAHAKMLVEKHPPWKVGWETEGLRRELWDVPGDLVPKDQDIHDRDRQPTPGNLYVIWKYAHTTGDWETIKANWKQISALYGLARRPSSLKRPANYDRLAGLIGYARMARHTGSEDADAARKTALVAIAEARRIGYAGMYKAAFARFGRKKPHDWMYPIFHSRRDGRFHTTVLFCPEVGHLLHDTEADTVRKHLEGYVTSANCRAWFLHYGGMPSDGVNNAGKPWAAPGGETMGGENAVMPPDFGWAFYMLHAYVLDAPPQKLRGWIDIPYAAVGDLCHVERLAAAIRAHGRTAWKKLP